MQSVEKSEWPELALVVHELRTPVAIIKAYAQLLDAQLARKQAMSTGSHEITAHILEQADLMSGWVDAMLDTRRMQLGKIPLDFSRVDLVQLAWMTAQELQQTTRLHRISVVASGPVPSAIRGDPARLRQVLTNVLENALKYTPGGVIQVRLGVQQGSHTAIVCVQDEGPGLDKGDLDRIFGQFEQAERPGSGLGLGLYLSREIARLHGGDLWAESRGPGKGCTFILALPMLAASACVPTNSSTSRDSRRRIQTA
jgi:signal transduction histidine kinase